MTISLSLEEQKKIILDRMEEARCNYRSSFIHRYPIAKNSTVLSGNPGEFPRSYIFKILTHHPYFTGIAISVALAVLRRPLIIFLKQNLALRRTGMLANKVKILVVAAIIRFFRSYTR